jgi:hypothetical protein
MKAALAAGALALALTALPSAALADDPKDPEMQSTKARARDRAAIRELNLAQLRYVRERDAKNAVGWQAVRDQPRKIAEYERRMAEWRHAVRMCRDGHSEYCAR